MAAGNTNAASSSSCFGAAAPSSDRRLFSARLRLRRGALSSAAMVALPAAAAAGCLLLLLAAFSAPVAHGQAYLPANMIDGMESAMFLNKFMDAADVTGYYDRFLEPDFAGTVFAPVDLGFDALLQKLNATWEELTSPELNGTLSAIVGLHVVPGARLFPLTSLRDGLEMSTASGAKIYIRRDVPGIVHVYAVSRPEEDPLNFATVLQYQEIRGGKAVLYVVDKVLLPPAKSASQASAAAAPAFVRRNRGAGNQRKAA